MFRIGACESRRHGSSLDQKTGSFSAIGDVKTVSLDQANPILIVGGRADGSEDKVVYSDGSELWRDRIHVKAQTIEIFPDQQRFVAVGGLDSTMGDVRVSSDRLEFEDATGAAHYVGHVRVRSDDAELDAGDLTLTLDEGSPTRVVARNEVIVREQAFPGSPMKRSTAGAKEPSPYTVETPKLLMWMPDPSPAANWY